MPDAQILLVAGDIGVEAAARCHQWAQAIADDLGLAVEYGRGEPRAILEASRAADVRVSANRVEPTPPGPMSAAEFVYRPDGRPDWSAMWQDFCELALFGGPPHRGEDSALLHLHEDDGEDEAPSAVPSSPDDAVEEIRRGILETTGLRSQRSPVPGWLAVECDSPKMAAWLAACILLENVEARCEDEWLIVPASPSFALQDEVKSVITVVAKVHHYWDEHVR